MINGNRASDAPRAQRRDWMPPLVAVSGNDTSVPVAEIAGIAESRQALLPEELKRR